MWYYRLHTADLVGARVYIIDCTIPLLVGVRGIISAVSKCCYYLLVDTIQPINQIAQVDDQNQCSHTHEHSSSSSDVITDDVNLSGLSNRKRKRLERYKYRQHAYENVQPTAVGNVTDSSAIAAVNVNHRNHTRPVLGTILRVVKEHCNIAVVLPGMQQQQQQQQQVQAMGRTASTDSLAALYGAKTPTKAAVNADYSTADSVSASQPATPRTGSRMSSCSGDERDRAGSDGSIGSDCSSNSDSDGDDEEVENREVAENTRSVKRTTATNDVDDDDALETNGNEPETVKQASAGRSTTAAIATKQHPLVVFDRNEQCEGGRLCVLYGRHYMPYCTYNDNDEAKKK